jgi:hypothetical protein
MVLEQIVVLLVDPFLNLVSTPFLAIEFEIFALSWAISDPPTHLICAPAWERSMVLNQI